MKGPIHFQQVMTFTAKCPWMSQCWASVGHRQAGWSNPISDTSSHGTVGGGGEDNALQCTVNYILFQDIWLISKTFSSQCCGPKAHLTVLNEAEKECYSQNGQNSLIQTLPHYHRKPRFEKSLKIRSETLHVQWTRNISKNQTRTLGTAELCLQHFSPADFLNPLSCVQLDAQQHRLSTVICSERDKKGQSTQFCFFEKASGVHSLCLRRRTERDHFLTFLTDSWLLATS